MSHDHQQKILEQYSASIGVPFYRKVMGDGAGVIHYGIYDSPQITMRQATEKVTRMMWDLAMSYLPREHEHQVCDIGSGLGGSAHLLALEMGAKVYCVDLCEHQNRMNEDQANRLGIGDKIQAYTRSFDSLPGEWRNKFDVVWSQEALCHAQEIHSVLGEVRRIVKNGGCFVFSDILLSPELPLEKAQAFQSVNAVSHWRTQNEFRSALHSAGFGDINFIDLTFHLKENFLRMRQQIDHGREELLNQGVPKELLDRFRGSLSERIDWEEGSVLQWGIFVSRSTRSNNQ